MIEPQAKSIRYGNLPRQQNALRKSSHRAIPPLWIGIAWGLLFSIPLWIAFIGLCQWAIRFVTSIR